MKSKIIIEDENEIEYCEIKLDVDGGVDDHDISPVYVLIPTKNEKSPLPVHGVPSLLHGCQLRGSGSCC